SLEHNSISNEPYTFECREVFEYPSGSLSNLRGTKFGDLMGDSRFTAHEQYKEHFMSLYLRESWGKVVATLRPDGGQVYSSSAKVSN
ncbi:unnamed protein product, partial [Linum tenue]